MEPTPNAKQAKVFDLNQNEVQLPEPVWLVPLVGTGGWPTYLQVEGGNRYNYDAALTNQYDTPCYIQAAE